jgi:DNA primase
VAEAGSFAEKVKQQADIVRVIGEYVRLKKTGQNFTGLCPFHQEKSPSFAVHPVRQIYHCFGCGVGGDVFKFVMEMDKCPFPEAIRIVAEKCGIPVPRPRERSPEEHRENQQRSALVEAHREAASFFARQLHEGHEGKVAAGYLEDRGLNVEAMKRFGLGWAPSTGDALLRQLKSKYPEKLLEASGLFSRNESGRLYDRFRRRIMFPISNDAGKVIAFGGRAMGDDMPKYMNSPETPIYSKSNVLYHLDRAKKDVRQHEFAVLVEGYMDAIAVAGAGVTNVVAACGTSLTEMQAKLLAKCYPGDVIPRVIVNYDPDTAGQAATDRSIRVLLAAGFDIKVLSLPGGDDPDKFIHSNGDAIYRELLQKAQPYPEYLGEKMRGRDLSTAENKLAAANLFASVMCLMPNAILRTQWASLFSMTAQINEPVLKEALRRAAAERRGEVKPNVQLLTPVLKPAERQLIRMLIEEEGFREKLANEIISSALHRGLESEKILELLISKVGETPDPSTLAEALEEKDRRLLFDVLFDKPQEATWEKAESCLDVLRRLRVGRERAELETRIGEGNGTPEEQERLAVRRMELEMQKRIDEAKVPPDELARMVLLRDNLRKKLAQR